MKDKEGGHARVDAHETCGRPAVVHAIHNIHPPLSCMAYPYRLFTEYLSSLLIVFFIKKIILLHTEKEKKKAGTHVWQRLRLADGQPSWTRHTTFTRPSFLLSVASELSV